MATLTFVAVCAQVPAMAEPIATLGRPLRFYAHDNSALQTYAFDIDSAQNVVGYYYDTQFIAHGYIRSANNTYTDLDYPENVDGTTSTFAKGINEKGVVIGNATIEGWVQGWSYDMQTAKYTPIRVPGAKATFVEDITEDGVVVGFANFFDDTGEKFWIDGFVLKNGQYTSIKVPGAVYTYLRATNENGSLAGVYIDTAFVTHSFTMDPDGTFHTIDARNKDGNVVNLYSITARNQAAGTCADSRQANQGCYVDLNTGAVTMFSVRGLSSTNPWSLKNGYTVGYGEARGGSTQGFVMRKAPSGTP